MSGITFRRYTSLPFLLDILYEKRLPLLDPATWDDKNDSYFIELYKKQKSLGSVLAICFAEAPETYQHWKIYSGDSSGVCIEFDKDKLLGKTEIKNGFVSRKVIYKTLIGLKGEKPQNIDILPFLKRYAFRGEKEYRILYGSSDEGVKVKYIPITRSDINRIIINPWVHTSVFDSVKHVINSVDEFTNIRVIKSTVVQNEKWKQQGDRATATTPTEKSTLDA